MNLGQTLNLSFYRINHRNQIVIRGATQHFAIFYSRAHSLGLSIGQTSKLLLDDRSNRFQKVSIGTSSLLHLIRQTAGLRLHLPNIGNGTLQNLPNQFTLPLQQPFSFSPHGSHHGIQGYLSLLVTNGDIIEETLQYTGLVFGQLGTLLLECIHHGFQRDTVSQGILYGSYLGFGQTSGFGLDGLNDDIGREGFKLAITNHGHDLTGHIMLSFQQPIPLGFDRLDNRL